MIHDTKSAQISYKQDEHNIYVIMKTMFPHVCHHNTFVATHALGNKMYYGFTLLVPINIYIFIYQNLFKYILLKSIQKYILKSQQILIYLSMSCEFLNESNLANN